MGAWRLGVFQRLENVLRVVSESDEVVAGSADKENEARSYRIKGSQVSLTAWVDSLV